MFLKVKRKLYSTYVQCVTLFDSKTWAVKVDDMQRLKRMEKMTVRWMCCVTLKDRKTSQKFCHRLGIVNVSDRVRQGRL